MVNLFFFFLLYLDYVLVYFTATLGLGRVGRDEDGNGKCN